LRRALRFSTLSVELRTAHATNERSASAPSTLSSLKSEHGSGCSCCSGPLREEEPQDGARQEWGEKLSRRAALDDFALNSDVPSRKSGRNLQRNVRAGVRSCSDALHCGE